MSGRFSEQEYAELLARRGRKPIESVSPVSRSVISREVKTDYKAEFEQQLSLVGIQVEKEFKFDSERRWRADYLIRPNVLIEYEGGIWSNGRHTRGRGFEADAEKYNAAILAGFVLIRITPKHVVSGEALNWVERAIILDQLGLNSHITSQE